MGLQESLSRVEVVTPFGFIKERTPEAKKDRLRGKTGKKGFASGTLPDSKRKRINARGGVNAHKNPKHLRCHEFTSEESRHHALIRWGKLPKGTPFVPKENLRKEN